MTNKFERQVKGLLGTKLGMTQVWDEDGKFVPVTVVKADSNVVTQIRNQETDGYEAVQIGFGAIDSRKVTKPLADRKSTRLNSSHIQKSRMPSSA